MKKSLRAKRMEKHHRRRNSAAKLQLVSLMDIFTILVFFLLLNSSDVEILQTDKTIALPESISKQKPDETLVIRVNKESLFVGADKVVEVADMMKGESSDLVEPLSLALQEYAKDKPLTEREEERGRSVTIMGDQTVPYAVLKRIMATSAATDYRDIALAVSQVFTNSSDKSLLEDAAKAGSTASPTTASSALSTTTGEISR